MKHPKIFTVDLKFQNAPGVIAVYLIPHPAGVVLVESGPASTLPALQAGLAALGYTFRDVTDVLLTHIHLDHAGAAGWLARQGARIHVHPYGAPHLINPEKLLASAARIYGEMMDILWGEFLSVPEQQLFLLQDRDELEIHGLRFRVLDSPGHANHHNVYRFEDTLFTGDVGGVRLGGHQTLRLPMPPPDFHLEKWRLTLGKLLQELVTGHVQYVAPTHFGLYNDPTWHLSAIGQALDEVEAWIEEVLPSNPSIEELRRRYTDWNHSLLEMQGINPSLLNAHEAANPAFMSADGIQRYWTKYRQEAKSKV